MEKLWKLTSSIEKPEQPISSIRNLSKSLSTIEKPRKSLSSVRNLIAQFFFGETFMETFCWFVLLKKVFVDEICLEVVWASLKNLCELTGSPYSSILFNRKSVKNKFVHGNSRQTLSRTKKRKNCNHWEGNTAISFLSKRKRCESILSKNTPVRNSLEKKQWSQFKVLRNPRKQVIRHGNSMKKKCYLEIHWIQFRYWKSQKIFSFKRNPPKWTSFTRKSRKLISPKEKSKKSTPTARIQRKLFLKTGKSKRRVFFARPWEQNMLIGKSCNKFLLKILLKISFMEKNSVEIVFFDSKNFMETNLEDFKTIKLSLSMKVPEVCSTGIDSMKTAFINGETRTNTISLSGTPDEPFSYKCNARKLVFLKENPPISSICNPRKFLSTTKKRWKSISSEKNPIHNLPWKNVLGKTSVDRFYI